ncbi:MAG: hypothetical protein COV48_11170 [Elusimicrobia bacterium CG11_big_fil_rev_8_21_14_0_20_64_6]|nr:MAG: hypothetical protein COV48_11170 [Elusimicrobia bacterium CG11_big_fil_rev_8_21_14_0_20_64_6]
MRVILFFAYSWLIYTVLRAVLRWLLQAPPRAGRQDAAGPADGEMVRDPECGVYVLRDRAVTRVMRGRALCFCSEECAAAHSSKN